MCDLREDREYSYFVSRKEGKEIADKYGMKFFHTSAKNDINVTKAFTYIVTDIVRKREVRLIRN